MPLSAQFALLLSLFVALGISARMVVSSLVVLGRRLRVGGFILGFVILGMSTSAPEFLVALNAVANKAPNLSLGNLIGASFVLVSLISGIAIILRGKVCLLCMVSERTLIFFSVVVFLPVLLAVDGILSVSDGLFIIGAFALFALWALSRERLYDVPVGNGSLQSVSRSLIVFLIGIVVLIVAAKYAVDTGQAIALAIRVSPLLVGLIAFSIGTNLPELALIVTSRKAAQRGLVFGDILGSASANTLIVGILATASPIIISDAPSFVVASLALAVALVLFVIFARTGRRMTGREGYIMIGLFAAFLVALALVGSLGTLT